MEGDMSATESKKRNIYYIIIVLEEYSISPNESKKYSIWYIHFINMAVYKDEKLSQEKTSKE